MRATIAGILFVACLAGATSTSATCSCQCIEGVARTLCSRQQEARENPSACGTGAQKVVCVTAPAPLNLPERFTPPEGANDCRAQRLWDPHSDSYSVVAKVCDVDPETVGRE